MEPHDHRRGARPTARILILRTGSTYEETRRRFGDFDGWFMSAMAHAPVAFEVRDVTRAPAPVLSDYSGAIVTGSPAAAYEDHAWIPPLEGWLRAAAEEQRRPVLAVCLGAQILAAATGGSVRPNPLGWEIGTVQVDLTEAGQTDPLLRAAAHRVLFQSTHRDLIDALPGEAVILAGNAMSPFQAFRLGGRVWGVQFHPEATPAILEDLIRARSGVLGKEAHRRGRDGEAHVRALLRGLRPAPAGRRLLDRFLETAGAVEVETRAAGRARPRTVESGPS